MLYSISGDSQSNIRDMMIFVYNNVLFLNEQV